MRLRSALSAATLVASGLFAASAPAAVLPVIATTGSSFTFSFDGFYNSTTIQGLTAGLSLSNFAFNTTTLGGQNVTRITFDYALSNTSSSPTLTSRVSNLAFDTSPNIVDTAQNTVTGLFNTLQLGKNQPNGIGKVEFCFTAANCPGGGSGGVTQGNSGSGSASLFFAGWVSSLTIDGLFVRYQDVSCAAGVACSTSASGQVVGVPEPGPLSLAAVLALGGFASAWLARRRGRAPAAVTA
jgi:hypothetical protein